MNVLTKYKNGNAEIELYEDGTRIILCGEDELRLDYPLNIDIRVSTACVFGFDPATNKTVCGFCHESSRVDGKECDYSVLRQKLEGLPCGIELAIGCNELTDELYGFLAWCKLEGFVCNLTINQGHVKRDWFKLRRAIICGYVHGLGISYRPKLKWSLPKEVIEYPHTVLHCIVGVDYITDILKLKDRGVRKILCLGEKDFGFNAGKVDLTGQSHKEWYWWIMKAVNTFDVVSFDNLALEQLNMKRFFTGEHWNEFYQGEHSMYINAVEGYYAPSSRSDKYTSWNELKMQDYYGTVHHIRQQA